MGGEEVRLLFPNEARLRDLTYAAGVYADILVRVTFGSEVDQDGKHVVREKFLPQFPLIELPVMLHSKVCLLHNKPASFLESVGECPYDQGGYFIIAGSEKILITHQEQAFNTLYTQNQEADPQIATYSSITCLSPETRQVRRVTFTLVRNTEALEVGLPYVRKPVPICILFRAFGIQSDQEIAELIFSNLDSEEAKLFEPYLIACFNNAYPILDTYSAIEYIKTLTKGFGEAHVLDILHNQTFVHVPDTKGARAAYLGDCVRQIYRVYVNLDKKTDRDDTRNQRILVSGFLTQMLFQETLRQPLRVVLRTLFPSS
jgi:DNA-directed RNA polymerase II subunit RPB2